jgi:hypothetical protein
MMSGVRPQAQNCTSDGCVANPGEQHGVYLSDDGLSWRRIAVE